MDGGRYRCMAENGDGVVAAEAVITIKGEKLVMGAVIQFHTQ